ncbi:MAG: hypothetical protein WCC06_03535 [Candidatus Aminicenantales bacterium]
MANPVKNLKPLFWETNVDNVDIQKNKDYIIERILEFGDKPAVKWLLATYPLSVIKKTLEESRGISKKSRNFWEFLLGSQRNA